MPTGRPYPLETKRAALSAIRHGRPHAVVAVEFGINPSTLDKWCGEHGLRGYEIKSREKAAAEMSETAGVATPEELLPLAPYAATMLNPVVMWRGHLKPGESLYVPTTSKQRFSSGNITSPRGHVGREAYSRPQRGGTLIELLLTMSFLVVGFFVLSFAAAVGVNAFGWLKVFAGVVIGLIVLTLALLAVRLRK